MTFGRYATDNIMEITMETFQGTKRTSFGRLIVREIPEVIVVRVSHQIKDLLRVLLPHFVQGHSLQFQIALLDVSGLWVTDSTLPA